MIIGHIARTQHDPQVTLDALGESVVAVSGAAGHLPVDELIAVIYLLDHLFQNLSHLLLGAGRLDFQQAGAVIQTVQMLLQVPDNIIAAVGGIIYTIAEVVGAVVHGNYHVFDLVVLAVVIA